jgi:predicted lactoylglutathione lyase
MSTTLFVNLPVKDLDRATTFFGKLGFAFFGASEDMASVIISEQTQVMLLAEPTFAAYSRTEVADPAKTTQVIMVFGLENPEQVDDLVEKALAAGATAVGEPINAGGRYQRGFADLDGHHWAALCLAAPQD